MVESDFFADGRVFHAVSARSAMVLLVPEQEKAEEPLRAAEDFLHSRIPLTRAMGVRVIASDRSGFTLEAPVALNSNHLQTAFGGSINAVATLAGYGLLWLALRDQPADIVIRESAIRFHQPIREAIRATCARPEPEALAAFRERFRTKGRARIVLQVRVEEDERLAAELKGTFVALRRPSS